MHDQIVRTKAIHVPRSVPCAYRRTIRYATLRRSGYRSAQLSSCTVPDPMKKRAPGWRASFKMRDGLTRVRSWVDGVRGRQPDFQPS